ncbi:DinB family protein [Micromonospora sp. NPDC126480]|uniref:DinB family protein n=1 Tax=Micromonospora sp. NPDC126480 TaxID=3155312 RepID=UPI00332CFA0C
MPATAADALIELLHDLREETVARLELISAAELAWQPHPDANSPAVTVWHVARWLDVLATRAFPARSAEHELWRTAGWQEATGYDPVGLGYRGLGTLTGYTPAQMRAVPVLPAADLTAYLTQSAEHLAATIRVLSGRIHDSRSGQPSPYQILSGTLQGSFGHLGEIDALVALRARLSAPAPVEGTAP